MPDEPESGNAPNAEEEDLYPEPKARPKIIRILTVLAYMSSVSMAAILLSGYYIFMWEAHPNLARRTQPNMEARVGTPSSYTSIIPNLNHSEEYAYQDVKDDGKPPKENHDRRGIEEKQPGGGYNSSQSREDVFQELQQNKTDGSVLNDDNKRLEELQDFEDTSKTFEDTLTSPIPTNDSREDMSTGDNDMDLIELSKQSLLYKKLFYKNIVMA